VGLRASRLNEKGQWIETGEMSRTSSEPRQFFEMRLTRLK
jgi:hypothetical protein